MVTLSMLTSQVLTVSTRLGSHRLVIQHLAETKLYCTESLASQPIPKQNLTVLEWNSFFSDHHVYYTHWTSKLGDKHVLEKRARQRIRWFFYMAVLKEDQVMGHILKSISRTVSFFLSRDGHYAFY